LNLCNLGGAKIDFEKRLLRHFRVDQLAYSKRINKEDKERIRNP
jgi:hypothetical protein